MGKASVSLPVVAGDGVGAVVSCGTLAAEKTLIVGGSFPAGVITVQISQDGTNFADLATFPDPGKQFKTAACAFMRAKSSGVQGSPSVDVGALEGAVAASQLTSPAGNGVGPSADVSALSDSMTFVVAGDLGGAAAITIEGSEDDTDYAPLVTFQDVGQKLVLAAVNYLRVRASGVKASVPFSPVVGLGTAEAAGTVTGGQEVTFQDDGSTTDVYVDAANGDDNNDGLSDTTALQTVQAVYRKFPLHIYQGGGLRINLAGVGGFGALAIAQLDYDLQTLLAGGESGAWEGNSYAYVGPEMVPYVPATGPATAPLDPVPAVAVAGGSPSAGGTLSTRFDFTVASPGWTPSDFQGAFLRITRGGVKVVYEMPIANNTADTITVRIPGVAPLILNTDTAEVVEPGAQFVNTADLFNGIGIRGRGISEQFSTVLGATFQRCAFSSPYIRDARGVTFDRCALGDKNIDGTYTEDCMVDFVNCTAPRLYAWGFSMPRYATYPKETSPTDPIPANRTEIMTLQIASSGPFLDLGGIGAPSTFLNKFGVGIDGGSGGNLSVYYQALFICVNPGGGYPVGTLQGEIAGSGTVIEIFDDGQALLFSNATPGRTSLYHVGGGNPLNLVDASVSIDYGTGVGDWEEAAGYAGTFWVAPAAGAPSNPNSYIKTA
ncbi:MAG: hypothetical protein KJO40_18270 [Deltaproteobacteria bacterium]|nr:hypothetical protein [Deltaproteobacteria bacterium]